MDRYMLDLLTLTGICPILANAEPDVGVPAARALMEGGSSTSWAERPWVRASSSRASKARKREESCRPIWFMAVLTFSFSSLRRRRT